MNEPLTGNEESLPSPRASNNASSKKRVVLVAMLVLLAGSLLLGFIAGWEGSRRLYIPARNEHAIQPGDAPADARIAVTRALGEFQDGYTSRDARRLSAFMEHLFPDDDHILICGTDAGEWIQGRASAERFIGGDWKSWGAVRLATNNPAISSSGDVAWLATTGTVTVSERARPIRFLAVLQRTGDRWRFRQIQYQWDIRPVRLSDLVHPATLANLHLK